MSSIAFFTVRQSLDDGLIVIHAVEKKSFAS
jgi:hypothetical protein